MAFKCEKKKTSSCKGRTPTLIIWTPKLFRSCLDAKQIDAMYTALFSYSHMIEKKAFVLSPTYRKTALFIGSLTTHCGEKENEAA